MGYVKFIKVDPTRLDSCDQCGDQGLKTSGRSITDCDTNEEILWICFTCIQREEMNRG